MPNPIFNRRAKGRAKIRDILLTYDVVKITFKKVTTNTTRVMYCTLKDEAIPETYMLSRFAALRSKSNLVAVWDVIKGKWRSFYMDNILSVDTDLTKSEEVVDRPPE